MWGRFTFVHVHVIQIPLEVSDVNLKFHDRDFLLKKWKNKNFTHKDYKNCKVDIAPPDCSIYKAICFEFLIGVIRF